MVLNINTKKKKNRKNGDSVTTTIQQNGTAVTSPTSNRSPRSIDDDELGGLSPPATSTMSSPPPQSVKIEHNVTTTNNPRGARNAGLIFGLSKPMLALLVTTVLGTSGAAAYFGYGWLEIPSLKKEIQDLESQIDRLSIELNRLEYENDKYASLNNILNTTVLEIVETNQHLEETTMNLQTTNDELNETNEKMQQQIVDLTNQNEDYADLNNELNTTAVELSKEVERFHSAVAGLVVTNAELSNFTSNIEDLLTGSLLLDNVAQYDSNATVVALEAVLSNIVTENKRLDQLNTDLSMIVSFLNEANLGQSFDKVTTHLSEQITTNRLLVLQSLENIYRQRIDTWDCDFNTIFFDYDFVLDRDTIVIGSGSDNGGNAQNKEKELVLEFVQDRIMDELCLDIDDFNNYMDDTYPFGYTSNQLATGILLYTSAALDYYFPNYEVIETPAQLVEVGGESDTSNSNGGSGSGAVSEFRIISSNTNGFDGLSPQVWADAKYKCDKLPDQYRVCVMC